MPPNCPGCGASVGTPPAGVHLFGCGYRGDLDDASDGRWKSRWNRGQQRKMIADALEAIGCDPRLAGEMLEVLRQDAEHKGKPPRG